MANNGMTDRQQDDVDTTADGRSHGWRTFKANRYAGFAWRATEWWRQLLSTTSRHIEVMRSCFGTKAIGNRFVSSVTTPRLAGVSSRGRGVVSLMGSIIGPYR
jgi:hypothetical protein